MTQTMKISEVKAKLSSLVNEVYRKEKRVLVEKAGIPVAAVVSIADLERLRLLDRQTEDRLAAIEQMREAFKDIPPEQIERDVVAIIRELRAADDAASQTEAPMRQPA
jgi:prevent-host-death family protein